MNERAISIVEAWEGENEMNAGKAQGLDGFLVECLKKGGMTVLGWSCFLTKVLKCGKYLWTGVVHALFCTKGRKTIIYEVAQTVFVFRAVCKLLGRMLIKRV